jgi:hypothetical protein
VVWRYVATLTPNDRQLAEDVVQETMVRALNAPMLRRYAPSGHGTGPWAGQPPCTRQSSNGRSLNTVNISEWSASPAVTSSPEAMYPL